MATPNSPNGSGTENEHPESIKDALRMLDDALSGDGADLKELVKDDYQHLKTAIAEMGSLVGERVIETSAEVLERGRHLVHDVGSRVRSNPWPYIGGVAVGSIALGYFIGRNRSETHRGMK